MTERPIDIFLDCKQHQQSPFLIYQLNILFLPSASPSCHAAAHCCVDLMFQAQLLSYKAYKEPSEPSQQDEMLASSICKPPT